MHQLAEPLSSEVQQALEQSYSYLGRGRQCYAFVSEDGQYVIKLPRLDSYEVSVWSQMFPKIADRQRAVRQKRKEGVAQSFLIAYKELKELTEALYCHLDPTTHIGRRLYLSDAFGRRFSIDLDQRPFFLQKKRGNLIDAFLQARAQNNSVQAKKILGAYLDLIVARSKRGVLNKDAAFLDNFGFDGKKAMQIDVGTFYHKEGIDAEQALHLSLTEVVESMKPWMAKACPEMQEWFLAEVRQVAK